MHIDKVLARLQEAAPMSPEDQKKADMRKKAIASAKKKNPSIANISDDDFDYDEASNTVSVSKMSPTDKAKINNVKVKI